MLQWAPYPVQQQQHRQRCQPVFEQTERFGLKPQLTQKRPLGVFRELTEGCFPSLSCLVLRFVMGHAFLWPKGHFCAWKSYQVHHLLWIIMHLILFIVSCNLSTRAWAGKGRLKAQFAFNSGETVSCSGRALQGSSGSIRILEDAVLMCWSTLLCFSEARKHPVIPQHH